ncbi:MAG: glycine C-acetyltransferase, partial [Holdemania filiformis]
MNKIEALQFYAQEVEDIKEAGLFKGESPIVTPQSSHVKLEDGREVINMCANNYLGLGNDPRLIQAAQKSYEE